LLFGAIENSIVWDSIVFETCSDLIMVAPQGRSGEFFGLYAIAGTITGWTGPFLVEGFTLWFNAQRAGMTSINLLFVIGVRVLLSVKVESTAKP